MDDTLKDYLKMIGKIPLLSTEEEMDLFKKIEQGDEEAKEKIITSNLRLVVSISKKMAKPTEDLLEVISNGNLGLFKAVEYYKYQKGYKFSTYATWWIRQSVMRERQNLSRMVRLPVHVQESIRKILMEEERLCKELGYPPTYEQIGENLGIPATKVEEYFQYRMDVASLAMKVGDDDSELEDFIEAENVESPEENAIQNVMKMEVEKLLKDKLNERELFVIKLRFGMADGQPHTLESIGDSLGVSRERVRQIESTAMSKLRRGANKLGLETFLVA